VPLETRGGYEGTGLPIRDCANCGQSRPIDWFWLRGWLNNKGALCSLILEFWYKSLISFIRELISLFERPRTRLLYKIGSQNQSMISAIDVTVKTFFERLYLVLGLRKIAPWVNCPYAPTTPTLHSTAISRFLCNFAELSLILLVITIHQVIWPSPVPNCPSFCWSSRFTK